MVECLHASIIMYLSQEDTVGKTIVKIGRDFGNSMGV